MTNHVYGEEGIKWLKKKRIPWALENQSFLLFFGTLGFEALKLYRLLFPLNDPKPQNWEALLFP